MSILSCNDKVAIGLVDNIIKIWDIEADLFDNFKGHSDNINCLIFSPCGK